MRFDEFFSISFFNKTQKAVKFLILELKSCHFLILELSVKKSKAHVIATWAVISPILP